MAFQYRFERLLKVNESEKRQLEQIYQDLFRLLEEQGKKLVDLMKRKEMLIKRFEGEKKKKMSIMGVREHIHALENIGHKIHAEQCQYEALRTRLERLKAELTDKAIEIKKYEKLKDVHFAHYEEERKRSEAKQMDEAAQRAVLKQ
ncbi:flagellar export protein FliJ [Tuberibacillus calidus]|jgi:flagellar FliJ protein|uniref:flagellar export protein FliJ n=1 Tax=Tuberibacillus calidus TaxID=340097 RepID=UPI000425C2F5|nr:flagellar export protein FliJ [Tuberibacillus calidus]